MIPISTAARPAPHRTQPVRGEHLGHAGVRRVLDGDLAVPVAAQDRGEQTSDSATPWVITASPASTARTRPR